MNGSLFIDAVGKLDADLVESYYLMDARLHAGLAKKKSRKKKGIPFWNWNARKISSLFLVQISRRDNLSADFPWKPKICWKIPVPN